MFDWKILAAAILVCIVLFVYARLKRSLTVRRIIQPLTTILVIVLASSGFFSASSQTSYTFLIVLGMIFCLVGDSNLVNFRDNTQFLTAVGFYCAGLAVYAVTLTRWTGINWYDVVAFILLLVVCGLILAFFLWEGMGKMRGYMIVYMITWCFLLCQSLTIFWSDSSLFSTTQKWLILSGTASFFIGDIVISFHQFNKHFQGKPFWLDIPLYFTGQGFIALSTSFF